MGTIGSFLKGAVAGVVGLGLLSWFIATQCNGESINEADEAPKEEE